MEVKPRDRHFEQHRGTLNGIAYRMLGSWSDAEDVVQDAWFRWQGVRLSQIDSPIAYLTSTVSRLCIDRHRRLKLERMLYQGPWLPEPVGENTLDKLNDPQDSFEKAESVSIAFLHLLQQLKPMERAVFILRESFDLSHDEIALMLDIRPANSRQLLRRAKSRVQSSDVAPTEDAEARPLMESFLVAASTGNLDDLKSLMADDIIAYSDGGGRVSAALIPLKGPDRVATVLLHLMSKQKEPLDINWQTLNGDISLVMRDSDGIHSTHTITVKGGLVHRVYSMRNPDKLGYVD